MPNDGSQEPVRSKIDDEVLEILYRADRPISFRNHLRRRWLKQRHQRVRALVGSSRESTFQIESGLLLILSVLAAVAAVGIRDVSPLFARLLALACVLLLVAPIVMRYRSPRNETVKHWRGKEMDYSEPSPTPPWIDTIRERFRKPPKV